MKDLSMPVRLQELRPGHVRQPLGGGSDPTLFQNPPYRGSRDPMPQIREFSHDSRVAPALVLTRHTHDQCTDLLPDERSARASHCTPVILSRDKLPMPTQNRIRCHDRFEFSQHSPSERMALRGQPLPLIIAEAQAFVAVQLAEHSVLFLQVCMDGSLLLVHPAR